MDDARHSSTFSTDVGGMSDNMYRNCRTMQCVPEAHWAEIWHFGFGIWWQIPIPDSLLEVVPILH
jgi:hypothetical protein